MVTVETEGGFVRIEGTEGRLAQLLASRQQVGIKKYRTTVSKNPLSLRAWLVHALEEALDLAVYLMRSIEELDRREDDGK